MTPWVVVDDEDFIIGVDVVCSDEVASFVTTAAVDVEVVADGDGNGVGTGDDGCLTDDDSSNDEETPVAIDDGAWIGCT